MRCACCLAGDHAFCDAFCTCNAKPHVDAQRRESARIALNEQYKRAYVWIVENKSAFREPERSMADDVVRNVIKAEEAAR